MEFLRFGQVGVEFVRVLGELWSCLNFSEMFCFGLIWCRGRTRGGFGNIEGSD